MNHHQTERVRSYLRGRLQLAIVPVGVRTGGGFIVAPLGQTTGSGDYYPTLEELAQRHGVTIPDSIMQGPPDNHGQPGQPRKPTEEEQRQIDEMGHCGDFYALSEYLEERGLAAPLDVPATIERVGTEPMRVHKSVVIRFLRTHPDEREQVIPGWVGTTEEYIAELERRPGQFFVNGELVEEEGGT